MANALIHQELSIEGAGPVIEIFNDRIEIANLGISLVEINRKIDSPPRSRNETLVKLMRYMKICEEYGSGWDRIVHSCELSQLPAPSIETIGDSTRVVLFQHIPFSSLSQKDSLRTTYYHACLKYLEHSYATNRSLRERFGLDTKESSKMSRLLHDAVENNMLKALDPNTAPKHMKYLPYWV